MSVLAQTQPLNLTAVAVADGCSVAVHDSLVSKTMNEDEAEVLVSVLAGGFVRF